MKTVLWPLKIECLGGERLLFPFVHGAPWAQSLLTELWQHTWVMVINQNPAFSFAMTLPSQGKGLVMFFLRKGALATAVSAWWDLSQLVSVKDKLTFPFLEPACCLTTFFIFLFKFQIKC